MTDQKTQATQAIQQVQPVVAKKPEANQAIDAKFEELKQAINRTPDATTEEKEQALQELTKQKEAAKQAINQVNKNADVESAKAKGLQSLENVHVVVDKKPQARQAINQSVNNQKAIVAQNNDATDEEKEEANRQIDAAKTQAINQIDLAQSDTQVDIARDNGTQQIGNVQPDTAIKKNAKDAIDQKAQQQIATIENNPDATTEEKAAAKNLVTTAQNEAKIAIGQNHTTQEVNDTKTNNIEKINAIQPSTEVKTNAKQALRDKANAQKEIINQTPNATDEEKEAAIHRVDTELAQALQEVQQAQSTDNVNHVKDQKIKAIDAIRPNVVKKSTAENEVRQKANEQIQQVQSNNEATNDEKEAAKEKINNKLNEVLQQISQSNKDAQVDSFKAEGIQAIENIHANPEKKQQVKNAINTQAESRKNAIRQNNNSTTEEKNEAIQKIDDIIAKSNEQIKNATTNDKVDEVQAAINNEINQVNASTATKDNARQQIDHKASDQINVINNNQDATQEEKQAAIEKVNNAQTSIKEKIQQAIANQNVSDAKDEGITQIGNIQPETVKKPAARDVITRKAQEQINQINANPDATTEEKEAAVQKVTIAKNNALQSINESHTNQDVQDAENRGVDAINNIAPETLVKQNAKQAIEQKAQEQINSINGNQDATTEEKTIALNRVTDEKAKAIQAIQNATSTQLVQDAETNGIQEIEKIEPSTQVKTDARQNVNTEANNKKALINQTPNATDEEKAAANQIVDQLAQTANTQISQSEATTDVNNIKDKAVQDINAVQPKVVKKQAAKNDIHQSVQTQNEVIDQATHATTEEKETAKNQVNTESTNANSAIDAAHTNNEVDQAVNVAKPKIQAIQPKAVKKPTAIANIQAIAERHIELINNNNEATQEEKDEAIQRVNQAVESAKQEIGKAQSNNDVENIQNTSEQNINQIVPNTQTKANARADLAKKAQAQKDLINNNPNSTIEEKNEAIAKVDTLVNQTKSNIDNATTNQQVQEQLDLGEKSIAQIQPSTAVKDNARAAIEENAEIQKQRIDQNDEATEEEKTEALGRVNKTTVSSEQAITDATHTSQVTDEQAKGINSIHDIEPIVVKKPAARAEFDKAVKTKKAEIYQNTEATEEEINKALQDLNANLTVANLDVTHARTNHDVGVAEQEGLQLINQFEPVINKKHNALEEINQAYTNKLNEINQLSNATQEERAEALQFINTEAQKARDGIYKAHKDAEVNQAKNTGLTALNEYHPNVTKKQNAIQNAYNVIDAQEEIINAYPQATDDEKQEAINKVEGLMKELSKQVFAATTNDGVDNAYNHYAEQIKQVFPDVISKPNAQQILKALANQLIHSFETTPDVTDEERDESIKQVNDKLNAILEEIENDTKDSEVAQDKVYGLNALNNMVIQISQKPKARQSIQDRADEVTQAILNTPYATDEEKQVALEKVKDIINDSSEAIHEAKTNNNVAIAKQNALEALNEVRPVVVVKPQAIADIKKQAELQKAKISRNSESTLEEKEASYQVIDQLVNQALDSINTNAKNQQVLETKDEAIDAISKVTANTKVKPAALQDILKELDLQKQLINSNQDATEEEKNDAIEKLIEASTEYSESIDEALTNKDVEINKNQSINEIHSILPSTEKKTNARNEVTAKAEEIRASINNNDDATQEEKDQALQMLNIALTNANQAIHDATDNQEVDKAKALALNEIGSIKVNVITKPSARERIKSLVQRKENLFNNYPNATNEEKQLALNKLSQTEAKINQEINEDQTNAQVAQALNKGLDDIDLIEVTAVKKDEALSYIEGYSDAKLQEQLDNKEATEEEKDKFRQLVNDAVRASKQLIAEAQTNAEVDEVVKNFKLDLRHLKLKATKKQAALDKIHQKAQEVNQMLDGKLNAILSDKLNAKQLVAQILASAQLDIQNATRDAEIDAILRRAIKQLSEISISETMFCPTDTMVSTFKQQCQIESNKLPNTGMNSDSWAVASYLMIFGISLLLVRRNKKDCE